ncbi:MAG: GNAT family N-acetyltransferase [Terracidiphilus sp.]
MAHLEVLRATEEERPILENLLELYIHDFSEFHAVDIQPDGRFGYPDLPLYWLEPGRHPFLARIDGDLVGFALVRKVASIRHYEAIWDMAEFFVLRGMRRHGIGTELAGAVWAGDVSGRLAGARDAGQSTGSAVLGRRNRKTHGSADTGGPVRERRRALECFLV